GAEAEAVDDGGEPVEQAERPEGGERFLVHLLSRAEGAVGESAVERDGEEGAFFERPALERFFLSVADAQAGRGDGDGLARVAAGEEADGGGVRLEGAPQHTGRVHQRAVKG